MFASPMLLQEKQNPTDDKEWLTELKLDGIRLELSQFSGTRLFSRHKTDVTRRFPELLSTNIIPEGTILDGELVLSDDAGRPDFEALMSRFMLSNPDKIKRASETKPITYCVFDILFLKGERLTHLPLLRRKELLNRILPSDTKVITKVPFIEGQGTAFFELCKKHELEGIVQKRIDSHYFTGKRPAGVWNKIIRYSWEDVWITGYRKGKLGWLLAFGDGKPAGILELGIPPNVRKQVYALAKHIRSGESEQYVYFRPDLLRCRVKYRNLTKAGLLRLPVFENLTV